MSTNVGAVDFELLLNSNPFNKGLKSATNTIKSSGIENSLKKIGKLALAAFSVKAIVNFGKECVNLGSDLAEVQNVVDVTFGNLNTEVNKFAENAIDKFGLGQTVTKKYVGTFGAMSKAFGFTNKEALAMSETLTGLAGDVASFYNLSSDEAYTKLKSVFTGETESLKDLGVVMTQNALDQYALANGYSKTTSKMTEQEKVALRYKFVLDKLSLANGDFARTSDSWANQTRVLSLRFNELKATLGQGFINIFTPIVKGINWVLSKLQVLANAFKSFTEMIFGNAGGDKTSSMVSNLATDASNASDAVSGIGESAKKSAKDLKSLASFDTAQVLKSDSNDSSSGGSGTGGLDFGNLSLADIAQQNASTLDSYIDKLKELTNIFKEGFSISFGDTNFNGILEHLSNIKNTLIDIWTAPEVVSAVNNWINTIAYSLGQSVGAIARIGVNVAEGLVGSVDNYLSQNKDRIKNFLVNMLDISSEGNILSGNFMQALGEISDVFSNSTAKQIGADIIAIFSNPLMSAIEICSKFALDLKGILFQPIIDNAEKIKNTLENTIKPLQIFTGTLAEAMTYVGDKWNEVYDIHIHPLMESIKTGLSDTFGKFLDVYNEYIVPFLDNVANGFNTLWEQHLKPLVDQIAGFIGAVTEALQVLWGNWLKPLIDWIVQNIIPAVIPVLESVWNTVSNVFGSITYTISGIIETFTGLINFMVGVFTGDWNKAWEGIKTFFSGIWNTMKGVVSTIWNTIKGVISTGINIVKTVISTALDAIKSIWNRVWTALKNTVTNIFNGIWSAIKGIINSILGGIESMANGIVRGVNKIIDTLNNLQVHIPDWVPLFGGKTLGFNINHMGEVSLPRLAEGGYVKANTPQLAMIGDNRHQGEVVAPEDKIMSLYKKANQEMGLGNNQKVIELLEKIIQILINLSFDFNLYIDSYELNKRLEKIKNKNKFATNGG